MNYSDAEQHLKDEHVSPSLNDVSPEETPLDEERLAFYRARLESGYYRSAEVVKHIAERLADQVHPAKTD